MRTELTAEHQRIVNDSPLAQVALRMGCVVVSVEDAAETQEQLLTLPVDTVNVEPKMNSYEKYMMRQVRRGAKNSTPVIRTERKQPIQPRNPARRV